MAKKNFDEIGINERVCPVCGKTFFPSPFHVYKRQVGNRVIWFCKYTCMTAWDREHPKKRQVISGEMR